MSPVILDIKLSIIVDANQDSARMSLMMEDVLLAIQDFNSLIKDFVDLEIVSISLPKAGHAMRALAAFNLLMECV